MPAYAEETAALLRLTGDSDEIADALNAGAQDIDSAFESSPHGYTTPLDPASFPPGDEAERLTAKLKTVNLDLAAWLLVRASERKPTSRIHRAYSEARAWLKQIRTGQLRFEFLATSPRTSPGAAIQVIGERPRVLTDDVFDFYQSGGGTRQRPHWPIT